MKKIYSNNNDDDNDGGNVTFIGKRTDEKFKELQNAHHDNSRLQKAELYQRHRNLINIGIGTGAGALLGGLIGGKKGALIGTAVGAGGSALYTYKINPKTKKRYRVYR